MPIYVYECCKCGYSIEDIYKYDDPPPECANKEEEKDHQMKKVMSPGGTFVLKGLGWYKTDYASKK